MPKGRRFTEQENHLFAKAFCWATNDGIKGVDQSGESFMERVLQHVKRHAPANAPEGSFHHRDVGSIQRQLAKIKADVAKFMASLRQVLLVEWSGIPEEQKVNMAVAVHLGKAKAPGYEWRNFNPTLWPNFHAYKVLSTLAQFQNPKVQAMSSASTTSSFGSLDGADERCSDSLSEECGGKRSASSRGGSGVKKAKKDLLAAKKEETRSAEFAILSKSIQELVDESRKTREEKVKDREMAELCTILDHSRNTNDLVDYLENKVRSRLGIPKPVPETVGLANPSDDQSSIGY